MRFPDTGCFPEKLSENYDRRVLVKVHKNQVHFFTCESNFTKQKNEMKLISKTCK